MRGFVATFILATIISAALMPVARRAALRIGAVSHPGGRNVQAHVVPRFGGIGIFVAFWVPLVVLPFLNSRVGEIVRSEASRIAGMAVGASLLCTLGVVDDTRRLRATPKFAVQVIAAVIAFIAGFRIEAVDLPFLGTLSMGVFALPVTVLWVVGIVNAINLIDGLDGLAAGVVFFAGITNFIVAYMTGSTLVAAVTASMLGSVLGFWFFNFNPARIFMGDSGSYFLGFILGTLSLVGASQKASTAVALLVPVIAMGLPIIDTLLSMVRRVLERRSIFASDRGHIHHRLLDMGLTHRRAVLVLYGVCIAFMASSIAVSIGRSWQVGVAILVASGVLIGIVRFVGYFEYVIDMKRRRVRIRGADAEAFRTVLPVFVSRLAECQNEDEVWLVAEALLTRAGVVSTEILMPADGEMVVQRLGKEAIETVSARFPIGPESLARSALRARWNGPLGTVSPQAEILLQVMVDSLATALDRVGSRLAATPAVPAAAVPARPSPVSSPIPVEEAP